MGRNHFPPVKPKPKPEPNPTPLPHPAGVPLIWWVDNDQGRTDENAGKANIGLATLTIQRDNGTLWRVSEDQPPYTWTQIALGDGTGDPYTNLVWSEQLDELKPWTRLLVSVEGPKTIKLAAMSVGDSFEIVDTERQFDGSPVTLIPAAGMKFAIIDNPGDSLTLDTVGQGTTWRFFVVASDIVVTNVP